MDNFSKLAIEDCLISQMPGLFSPELVAALDDDAISEIAMETDSAAWERGQNDDRLELCYSALVDLKSIESIRAPGNGIQDSGENTWLRFFAALRVYDLQGPSADTESEIIDGDKFSDEQADVSLSRLDLGLSEREDEHFLTNGFAEDSGKPVMSHKKKKVTLNDAGWMRSPSERFA